MPASFGCVIIPLGVVCFARPIEKDEGDLMTLLLYIDPGTGSMLFTILNAVIGSLIYLLRGLKVRLSTWLGRGKREADSEKKLPLVIFSDNKRYWPIFEPIWKELEKKSKRSCIIQNPGMILPLPRKEISFTANSSEKGTGLMRS